MLPILNPAHGNLSNSNRNLDIELFRAYAIAITLVAHFGSLIPEYYAWSGYFWLGGGVDLFFSISGFLITRSLLESLEANNSFFAYAKLFWIRRVFRLWPAAFFWSSIVLAVSVFFNVERSFGGRELVLNSWVFGVLNIENLYIYVCANQNPPCGGTPLWHYWSLSLEEQFYLLLPFFLFFIGRRKLLIWPCLIIAIYQATSVRPWGSLLWFIRSDALMYGTVIALGWHYYRSALDSVFSHSPRWCLQALLSILLVLLILVARDDVSRHYHGLVAVTAGFMVLIASKDSCLFTTSRVSRFAAKYIGSRSYSLYLVHLPVFSIMRELILNFGLLDIVGNEQHRIYTVVLGLAAALIIADFSFRFIESPLRTFGRRISIGTKNKTNMQIARQT